MKTNKMWLAAIPGLPTGVLLSMSINVVCNFEGFAAFVVGVLCGMACTALAIDLFWRKPCE